MIVQYAGRRSKDRLGSRLPLETTPSRKYDVKIERRESNGGTWSNGCSKY